MVNNDARGLGRRLKVSRIWAGLEQQDMADRLEVARSTISAWETGRTEPNATNFAKWSLLTGQTMEWLAGDGLVPDGDRPNDPNALQLQGVLAFAS